MLDVERITPFFFFTSKQHIFLNCKYSDMKHLMDFLLVVPFEAVVVKMGAKNNIVLF